MTVIGIDPGKLKSAIVVVQFDPFKLLHAYSAANPIVIEHLVDLTDTYWCGMQSTAGTALFWAGRFAQVVTGTNMIPHIILQRSRWRRRITKSHDISDENVRAPLTERFGSDHLGGPLYGIHDKVWNALGVAVCVAHEYTFPEVWA